MSKNYRQWSVKHRPTTFEEVVGCETAVSKTKTIAKKQDTHAILYYGPSGSAKTTLAKILARMLTKHESDIVEKNISDERGIDAIRGLINQSKFKPRGGHRVFILDEVHALLGQSQSAILKTLEEPEHDRVVWILCTDRPHMLDDQLLNRLYKIGVEKPSEEELAKLLYRIAHKEKAFDYEKDKIKRICLEVAKISDRVPREAIQLLKEVSDGKDEFKNYKDLIIRGVRKSIEKSVDQVALQVLMALYSKEKKPQERAEYLVNQLNDKDVWGTVTRLVDIHHALLNHAAGVKTGASFYYVKELEQRKAIPSLRLASKVAIKLVAIKNSLVTTNSSIHHFVVPELVNILYDISEKE